MAFVWWSYLPESLSARRVMESVVLTLEVILHLVQNYLMGSGCYLKGHTGRFAGAERSGNCLLSCLCHCRVALFLFAVIPESCSRESVFVVGVSLQLSRMTATTNNGFPNPSGAPNPSGVTTGKTYSPTLGDNGIKERLEEKGTRTRGVVGARYLAD